MGAPQHDWRVRKLSRYSVVPLTRGLFAVIDHRDAERVGKYAWHACRRASKPHLFAAGRTINCATENPKTQLMHRFILRARKHQHVDHVNGNPLDNRRKNIRLCSRSENACNRNPNTGANHGLPLKGIRKTSNGRWQARIALLGRSYCLGRFDTPTQAAKAYNRAALKLHGAFAKLNRSHHAGKA